MQHVKGFTLLELMIATVIVAILAGIALPTYNDYVLRGKFIEATSNLADLRVKMEQFYMDNRVYNAAGDLKTCGIPGGIKPNVSDVRYFDYECATDPDKANPLGAQTYVLTAKGIAAQGLDGIWFTVNEKNGKGTQIQPGSAMEKRGYAGAAACWVRKKPGEC
jgi:type IV pilus assembly protein PilE